MRISASAIGDLAYEILAQGLEDELGSVRGDLIELEKAALAIEIKRAVWTGQKRITIDIAYPTKGTPK